MRERYKLGTPFAVKIYKIIITHIFSQTCCCWQHFRSVCMKNYGLDPAHFHTSPGLSFQACLKMTGAKLELFTEPEKHSFIESSIRGGVSMISNRYARANNKYTEDGVDSTVPTSFIAYLDANNLYGHAMSQPLPTGNFRFLSEHEIENLDLLNVADDNPTGTLSRLTLLIHPNSTNCITITRWHPNRF